MCRTVLQQILANSTKDVPARYNSFLLHILEDYRRLIAKDYDQAERLRAEVASHGGDNDTLQRTSHTYVRK